MSGAAQAYPNELIERFGKGWNRFWFTPSDPRALCLLRLCVGSMAFYYLVTFGFDLTRFFGANGLLPVEVVGNWPVTGAPWSYLSLFESPTGLWTAHAIGLVIVGLFTAGLFTRVTTVLSLVVVLSYVHRGPMLSSEFEPVLTMLLAYLCLSPTGGYYSLDRLLRKRAPPSPTSLTTVATRLIQVHLATIYLMMAASQLAPLPFESDAENPWWRGEALWWLIANPESRSVDVTSWFDSPIGLYFINAWTHAILAVELAFPILIWVRLARPLVIGATCLMWISLAPIIGNYSFPLVMLAANLAFVSPAWAALAEPAAKRPA